MRLVMIGAVLLMSGSVAARCRAQGLGGEIDCAVCRLKCDAPDIGCPTTTTEASTTTTLAGPACVDCVECCPHPNPNGCRIVTRHFRRHAVLVLECDKEGGGR